MEAAHHPNTISRRSGIPCPSLRASRYSGNRKGTAVSPSSDLPRSRIEGYGAAKHTRVTALRPLSLHSLSTPIFVGGVME